jgi:phosphatidylethanolamine/phosphatidyl-N-methylethanolamine N-methyltransferase
MGDSTHKPSADSSDSYFAGDYQEIMYTGLIGWFSRLTHELMDRPFRNTKTPVVLEVGAGVGQHARYSRTDFDTYYSTDISDDALAACTTKDPRVIIMKADAQHLSTFADESVDRVVATCLLAHLDDPEQALQEWRRVLKPGGSVSIYVPAEPGMLLRLLRHLAVVPKSRRLGNDHLSVIYRDHRNHYPSMRLMVLSVFSADDIHRRRFPTSILGWNFSLFDIFHITKQGN